MTIVFDTNVLSTFIKINRLDLLKIVFGKQEFLIPQSVYTELSASKEYGSIFIGTVSKSGLFGKISLSKEENELVIKLREYKILGEGEIEALAVSKIRGVVLVTNDIKAKSVAESFGVKVVDLLDILRFCLKSRFTKYDIEKIIEEIETKDNIIIKNKELIFR